MVVHTAHGTRMSTEYLRADQCADVAGDREAKVAAVLIPALLISSGGVGIERYGAQGAVTLVTGSHEAMISRQSAVAVHLAG